MSHGRDGPGRWEEGRQTRLTRSGPSERRILTDGGTPAGREVTAGIDVTVERAPEAFAVPAVRYRLTSNRDRLLQAQFREPLPPGVDPGAVSVRTPHENGTVLVEDGAVIAGLFLDTGESAEVLVGVEEPDADVFVDHALSGQRPTGDGGTGGATGPAVSRTGDGPRAEIRESGVALRRDDEHEAFPVPAITFDIESERDHPVEVELRQPMPGPVDVADVGFHPRHGGEHWAVDGDDLTYRRWLDPGEETGTMFGIRDEQAAGTDWPTPTLDVRVERSSTDTVAPNPVVGEVGGTPTEVVGSPVRTGGDGVAVRKAVESAPDLPFLLVGFELDSTLDQAAEVELVDEDPDPSADLFTSDGMGAWTRADGTVSTTVELPPGDTRTVAYGVDIESVPDSLPKPTVSTTVAEGDRAAESFAAAAPEVVEAAGHQTGDLFHVYRGRLDGVDHEVGFLTPNPDLALSDTDSVVRAARRWVGIADDEHVATALAYGEEPRPWVAGRMVGWATLATVRDEFERDTLVRFVREAGRGLASAARYSTRHLALTPFSVVVYVDGDEEHHAAVSGWGVRQAIAEAAGSDGTTPYSAPEVADDSLAMGSHTDVYGLGAVAYYVLAGEPPVDSTSDVGSPVPIERRDADVPAALASEVMRALARDPAERHDSPSAFERALGRAVRN